MRVFAYVFINVVFITRNKLSKMILLKLYKLRLIDDKLAFDILYIILVKSTIKDYVKDL